MENTEFWGGCDSGSGGKYRGTVGGVGVRVFDRGGGIEGCEGDWKWKL